MKLIKGLTIASAISLVIAMTFSMLPTAGLDHPYFSIRKAMPDEAVIQMLTPMEMNERVLVTFLKSVPVQTSYRRVVIEDDRLFIDLKVSAPFQKEHIYLDAAYLVSDFFRKTTNVNELYISFRVVDHDEQTDSAAGSVLAMAVVVKKEDEIVQALRQDLDQSMPHYFLEKYTHLIYGSGWSN